MGEEKKEERRDRIVYSVCSGEVNYKNEKKTRRIFCASVIEKKNKNLNPKMGDKASSSDKESTRKFSVRLYFFSS